MSEIIIRSGHSTDMASSIVVDALRIEERRLGYALQLGKKTLDSFETKKYF